MISNLLSWFPWILNTNYFDSIRMALYPLIIIIHLKPISQLLYVMIEIISSRKKSQSACSNNSRNTWKTLNSLIRYKNTSKDVILNHDGSTVSDPPDIAEVFNNYFSNVASNLDSNIPHPNISPLNFLGAPAENSFFCAHSDREEIVDLIHRQKNKSTDLMNIPLFIYPIFCPYNFSDSFDALE